MDDRHKHFCASVRPNSHETLPNGDIMLGLFVPRCGFFAFFWRRDQTSLEHHSILGMRLAGAGALPGQ